MLKREDNELLTRVGRGTPMGELLRRFWVPALLSEEVAEPDGPPARVRLLGETLVAFRDTNGKVGLLDAYCPHRRANLFWGRNEECGLRCVYHGWKFNVSGECVDLPNVPDGGRLAKNMQTVAYPTMERSGIVWAYLGPPDRQPPFPETEAFNVPVENRFMRKIVLGVNWFQSMEGDVDSSHVSFLHSSLGGATLPGTRLSPYVFADTAPRWLTEPTSYGVMLAAQRDAGPDHYSWRINQWIMPYATLVAAPKDMPFIANVRVPMDDENTMHFRIYARVNSPLNDEDYQMINGGVLFPEMIPGTFQTVANIDNDYLVDRDLQKKSSYTGIKSIPTQDYAVTQDQGGGTVVDRSLERLVASDHAIIAVRRRIIDAAKALAKGEEPKEPFLAAGSKVRPIDMVLPRNIDVHEGASPHTVVA